VFSCFLSIPSCLPQVAPDVRSTLFEAIQSKSVVIKYLNDAFISANTVIKTLHPPTASIARFTRRYDSPWLIRNPLPLSTKRFSSRLLKKNLYPAPAMKEMIPPNPRPSDPRRRMLPSRRVRCASSRIARRRERAVRGRRFWWRSCSVR
jgi:hypothetical protein